MSKCSMKMEYTVALQSNNETYYSWKLTYRLKLVIYFQNEFLSFLEHLTNNAKKIKNEEVMFYLIQFTNKVFKLKSLSIELLLDLQSFTAECHKIKQKTKNRYIRYLKYIYRQKLCRLNIITNKTEKKVKQLQIYLNQLNPNGTVHSLM